MGNSLDHLQSNSFTPPATVLSPEQSSETFTCEICVEPTLSSEQRFKNRDICIHPFCKDCIIKYIQVKVEDDNIAAIKCPGLSCDYDLDPLSCRLILPDKLFVKWCDVLCKDTILGLNHCYCPNQQCSAIVLNECDTNLKKSVCPNCKKAFCFKCNTLWHDGFSCEERQVTRDANDVAFGVLVEKKGWKRCPRCRHYVQHRGGCSNIRCRCGINFCYKCGFSICKCGIISCLCFNNLIGAFLMFIGFFIIYIIIIVQVIVDVTKDERVM